MLGRRDQTIIVKAVHDFLQDHVVTNIQKEIQDQKKLNQKMMEEALETLRKNVKVYIKDEVERYLAKKDSSP